MTDDASLTRTAAANAVADIGWRYLLDTIVTTVAVPSLEQAVAVAAAAVEACGADADGHLRVDVRPDRVELSLQTRSGPAVTPRDPELAQRITASLTERGCTTAVHTGEGRSVQSLEMAIDAIDIAAIRPFWKAVLAYADEPGRGGPEDAVVDPVGQGPAIWFQQMDAPRPQRNRIHFDITVAADEADARVQAALAAGGVLVSDSEARSFWVLADIEVNEVCVCTWQDRDA